MPSPGDTQVPPKAIPPSVSLDKCTSVGALVKAHSNVDAPGSGYLTLQAGEEAEVLYVGDPWLQEEEGWLFCAVLHGTPACGWLPRKAVTEVPPEAVCNVPVPPPHEIQIGQQLWAWRRVACRGEGYLSLGFGASVSVTYVGTPAEARGTMSALWLYCRALEDNATGWVPSEALSALPPTETF